MKPLRLMIVCGEPSGDLLGAQLMTSLRQITGGAVEFCGVGGEAMAALGFQTLFPLEATSVMGIVEIVPRIPQILGLIGQVVGFAVAAKPDAVIIIDSPEFTQRVARRIRKAAPDIRIINYVAPQVWAMRSYRAKSMATYLDLVLALLPFEPPFFEKYGLKSVFVGHPAVERAAKMVGGDALRARLGIAPNAPLLGVLPGSRNGEVSHLLAPFRDAVARVAAAVPGLVTFIPLVPHVADRVRAETQNWPAPLHYIEGEADKFAAFDAADVALAASGTVTTELALSGTPTVVGYHVAPITAALVRRFIHVKFASLTNLIADAEVMPEFIQGNCTAEKLGDAVIARFTDTALADRQRADQFAAMQAMGLGGEAPSLRAAKAVVEFLG
ncbi:MAG: lipid-A-disaccharide synthase [Rhizomicrobium sp.]